MRKRLSRCLAVLFVLLFCIFETYSAAYADPIFAKYRSFSGGEEILFRVNNGQGTVDLQSEKVLVKSKTEEDNARRLTRAIQFNSLNSESASFDYLDLCNSQEWEILLQTDRLRMAAGLLPLSTFSVIQQASGLRAHEIQSVYAHTRPDGQNWRSVLWDCGLSASVSAENVGICQQSVSEVMQDWVESESHLYSMMRNDVVHMGMGYEYGYNTWYGGNNNAWEQLFLADECVIETITVSAESVAAPVGTDLESLGLVVTLHCSKHGNCILPLLSAMVADYDPWTPGWQQVSVHYDDLVCFLDVAVLGDEMLLPLDVEKNSYIGDAVECALQTGLYETVKYVYPQEPVTLEEVLLMLYYIDGEGQDLPESAEEDIYDRLLLWANRREILSSTDELPDRAVTREQMVCLLYRLAGTPSVSGEAGFRDVVQETYYSDAVVFAREQGIVFGTADGLFHVGSPCTRGDALTMIFRYLD